MLSCMPLVKATLSWGMLGRECLRNLEETPHHREWVPNNFTMAKLHMSCESKMTKH